jgi:hypothetical protein
MMRLGGGGGGIYITVLEFLFTSFFKRLHITPTVRHEKAMFLLAALLTCLIGSLI